MEIWLLKEMQLWLRCHHTPGKEPELGGKELALLTSPDARGQEMPSSLFPDPARPAGYPGAAAGPSICRGGGEGHWDSEDLPPVGHLVLFHLSSEKNHIQAMLGLWGHHSDSE